MAFDISLMVVLVVASCAYNAWAMRCLREDLMAYVRVRFHQAYLPNIEVKPK